MRSRVSLIAVGNATSLLLVITYLLCLAWDLVFPQYAMYESWRKLLPGFEWLSWKGFSIGLIEAYGYGWYFALIWVPLYNVTAAWDERRAERRG